MTVYAAIEGHRITAARLRVANVGPWTLEADLEGAPELSGRVNVEFGDLALSGTVDPSSVGVFGLQTKVRIIAGAGGWSSPVTAQHYHNDARVKARTVAEDAARAVGEVIGGFVPTSERLGVDYVRQATTAATALEDAAAGAVWWVDLAGVTHVGPRPSASVEAGAVEVLAYDPRERIVTLAADDLGAVGIGSVLSEHLEGPQTIRDYTIELAPESVRIVAWCGGDASRGGRLAEALRSIVERSVGGSLHGKFRYRVVRMASDRVELQAVRAAAGLPDVLPVSMWPGVPGATAILAAGAEVLVEFIEGNRALPIVTAYAGPDGAGFVPTSLTLGGLEGSPAARVGDTVEVLLPPAVFSGTVGGAPATGVLTFPLAKTLGTITTGSSVVKVSS